MNPDDRPTPAGAPQTPAEPWDDERLVAAFADRYDRPAPRELTAAVLERVTQTRRRPGWWPRLDRPETSRVAASVVVGVVVVALVGIVVLPPAASEPSGSAVGSAAVASRGQNAAASPAQTTPSASSRPSPAVEGFAAVAARLPVRSVTDTSILLADPTLGDTEFAVAGWYSASDLALPCPYPGPRASPIQIRCEDVRAGLAATTEPIFRTDGSSITDRLGASDVVSLRFVPPVESIHGTGGPRSAMVETPRPVILIGHFHDERAARCPADERKTCEGTFVVDGMANPVSGELSDPSRTAAPSGLKTHLSAADAARLAQDRVAGSGRVLSVGILPDHDVLSSGVPTSGDCLCPPTWYVRGYRVLPGGATDPRPPGTPIAAWLTIDDATGTMNGPLSTGVATANVPFPFAPAPDGFPATIEGLPVRTVADVVDPDRPIDLPERPIAVAGWFTQLPIHPCPTGVGDCNRANVVLAGSDKRLVTYGPGGSVTIVPSDGPVLNAAVLPGGASPPPVQIAMPMGAVFIVHAGDPRADRNGPGDPVGRGTFVLDQVAWLNGQAQPQAVWIEPGLKSTRSIDNVLLVAGPISTGRTWTISIAAFSALGLRTLARLSSVPSWGDASVWVIRLVGSRPFDRTSGPNGWGRILVNDATGEFRVDWSPTSP